MTSRRVWTAAVACLAIGFGEGASRGDTFTYRDEDGKTVTVEARLAGEGQGQFALELDDGQFRIIPQGAVSERKPSDGPKPITPAEMITRLNEKFGTELFRAQEEKPYVIGLVLASPIQKSSDARVRAFFKKGGKFMKTVEGVFEDFCKQARLPIQPARFPLVLLVFETDADFEKYTNESTKGRGLSAGNIAGFYSGLTNWLAIRLNECHTMEVPLHEAIHQQVYNRQLFQRLAPVPKWFNEGIATGFEGNGEKVDIGPFKINSHYARLASQEKLFGWDEVVANDRAFVGDILAGQAYVHAWCLHWMLCSRHKEQYTKYVKTQSEKKTLETITGEDRQKEFEDAFGKGVSSLQKDFRQQLELGMKRQKVSPEPEKPAGFSRTTTNLAEVELTAVSGIGLEVGGTLKNISPIRAMSYHVTVETDAGVYADWHVHNLEIRKSFTLQKQIAQKVMANAPGGRPRTFRVRVKSVPPDSRDADAWRGGTLPVPVYGGGREVE